MKPAHAGAVTAELRDGTNERTPERRWPAVRIALRLKTELVRVAGPAHPDILIETEAVAAVAPA